MNCLAFAAGLIFLSLPLLLPGCAGSSHEITFTTDSDKALQLVLEGIEKQDNFFHDQARALFGKAVALDSQFAIAYFFWALSSPSNEDAQARFKLAAQYMDKASQPEQLLIKSHIAMMHDSTGKAHDLLEELVRIKPKSMRAHYLLGNFYYRQQEWDNAEKELKASIDLEPSFAAAYNLLGYLYVNTQRYPEAIQALKKYSELRPNEPNPHDSMGEIFLAMGDYENSIKQYRRALSIESDFIYSRIGIGHNYVFMGDFAKARETYEEVFRNARNSEDTNNAFYWISVSYIHEQNFDKALEIQHRQLEYARGLNDIYVQANVNWRTGAIFYQLDMFDSCLFYMNAVREIYNRPDMQPGMKDTYMRDTYGAEAIVLTRLGQRDEVNKRLAEIKKSAIETRDRLVLMHFAGLEGVISYWNKDYETAIKKLSEADPLSAYHKYYLGMAYYQSGQREKAADLFRQVVEFNRNGFNYALVRPLAQKMLSSFESAS